MKYLDIEKVLIIISLQKSEIYWIHIHRAASVRFDLCLLSWISFKPGTQMYLGSEGNPILR